jgi:hypothetical protein
MALVLLKTGIIHPTNPAEGAPYIDQQQMITAQKLLLFWRKPAVRLFHTTSCAEADRPVEEMLVGWC